MTELFDFLVTHRGELLARLAEHVVLVVVSTAVAALIGIPVGVLASRRPSLARPLIGLANLAQTIPSLALFGLLIPLPVVGGIGTRTALIALTVYAVLPIVRTTLAGIQGIDRAVIECAFALGMTPHQVLRRVELPLAAPSILAGVRVATVVSVGTATIASAIGAGGLGDFIFRGLSMVDPVVIVAGALPAAILALLADGLLAVVARRFDYRLHRRRKLPLALVAPVAVILALLALASTLSGPSQIVVGSKNFTEQIILGEVLAQTIERFTSLTVERRLNLGGTLVCHEAMRRGDIDLYVEYTGTALTALFNQEIGQADTVFDRVRALYADQEVTMLPGLGFNNTFAILVRSEEAQRHALRSIGDLARVAATWRAGFGYEFLERPDGFNGLSQTYSLRFREPPRVMDLNLIYRALAAGEIDVTAGDATSGLIDALQLIHLQDDRRYFPPYDAVPVVRTQTWLRYPELEHALARVSGRLDAATMRRMNHQVDGQRQDARQVARQFVEGL